MPGHRVRALLGAALLGGCGESPTGLDLSSEGYVGQEGTILALGPSDNPRNTPIWIDISADQWDLLEGDELASADLVTAWPVDVTDGLWVDGAQLLPDRLQLGDGGEGVTVTERGEHEVYYGVFEDTVSVEVDGGPFSGELVFARDVGLIRATWSGRDRELVYYE